MRKNEDESQDEGDLEAQAEQHQNEDDAAAEDDNATQPNIPSEQEEEEEAEGDNNVNPTEEEDDATAPPPKKKKPVIVWDPDTDPVVVNVRQFFEENPEGPVSQQSVLVQVDEAGDEVKVPIGKTMYTLRTKSRHEKPTQMTQDRLKALQDLPQFVAFLQQPTVSKPKPSAEIAHMTQPVTGIAAVVSKREAPATHRACGRIEAPSGDDFRAATSRPKSRLVGSTSTTTDGRRLARRSGLKAMARARGRDSASDGPPGHLWCVSAYTRDRTPIPVDVTIMIAVCTSTAAAVAEPARP